MTNITRERLEALLAEATPGDWYVLTPLLSVATDATAGEEVCHLYYAYRHNFLDEAEYRTLNEACAPANAELIAASKRLAARVIELEAEVERLRDTIEWLLSSGARISADGYACEPGIEACGPIDPPAAVIPTLKRFRPAWRSNAEIQAEIEAEASAMAEGAEG